MRVSLDAEHASNPTTGPKCVSKIGQSRRHARTQTQVSNTAWRPRSVVFAVCLVALFLQGSMAATTDVHALEKLRVAELKQILKRRGLSCDGCTEKRAYVDMVVESSHLDRGHSAHRMRSRNPNDWELPRDDFRIDLWATLAPLVAQTLRPVLSFAAAYPLLVAPGVLALGLWGLRIAHQRGKHNDIPFKQYLRFQARLQYKHALRLAKWVGVQVASVCMVAGWVWAWVRERTWKQLGYTAASLGTWALFSWLGFGAVYVMVMALVTVFMNLGERKAGQASAYTIFNNFMPLEGELRMEQVEAEMRHMPMPRQQLVPHAVPAAEFDEKEAVVKAGRNDKVEVEAPDGTRKTVKVKNLQEHLDRGFSQVERVRYDGIIYRSFAD